MKIIGVIPARYRSSRFPGKPLADICGRPMIWWVYRQAKKVEQLDAVYVATDDERIQAACESYGIPVVMTSPDHPTGSDRVAEVAAKVEGDLFINIQGDEPLMPAEAVNQTAALLADRPECAVATAAHTLTSIEDFFSPNVVKVELDNRGNALTFSRAPIPWPRDAFRKDQTKLPEGFRPLHHLGLYAYRVGFLKKFPTLAPAPIEEAESLEQLRALWNGEKIAVLVLHQALPAGVDTEEDLERVRAVFASRQ